MSLDALFRFRAGREIGGGHAIRCLSLAEELHALGWDCALACNAEALQVVGALQRSAVRLIGDHENPMTELLVIDDYGVDALGEESHRGHARRLLVIDDLADRPHVCEILMDPTPGVTTNVHVGNVPEGCRLLLGPKFAPLRPAFRRARQRALARRGPDGIGRVLVMPGQVDQADLATLALGAIRQVLPDAEIDIVLGAGAPHRARLEGVKDKGVTIHVDLDAEAMADLMVAADLAIGAGGGGALERCALALPTVLVIVADNQKHIAAGLDAVGAAHVAGWMADLDCDGLASVLEVLSAEPSRLKVMSDGAGELCDGHGTRRFAIAAVAPFKGYDMPDVMLRRAEVGDAETMYAWQSDPETRRFARNPDVPSWEGHVAWLNGKLDDEDCVFAIVEQDAKPAGLIRLDREGGDAEVSIVIAQDRRGQGLGKAALALARRLLPRDRLTAFVKPENLASKRLFEQAGYVPAQNNMLQQLPRAA